MASISLRRSIAWLPAPPSEPTSTLVLTSPGRRFVDVRLRLPGGEQTGLTLDWAFAGTSSSEPAGPGTTRGVWRHWVDSRFAGAAAEAVVDTGLCAAQADGSTRETGAMAHPATGAVAPYEEVWADVAVRAAGEADGAARCVVLQLDAAGARGSVVVLGRVCQGIARTAADGVTVERWEWAGEEEAGWRRVFRSGTGMLPCAAAAAGAAGLRAGAAVACGGDAWTVVEAGEV